VIDMPARPCGVEAQVEGMNWNVPVAPDGLRALALPPDSQAETRRAQATAAGPCEPKAASIGSPLAAGADTVVTGAGEGAGATGLGGGSGWTGARLVAATGAGAGCRGGAATVLLTGAGAVLVAGALLTGGCTARWVVTVFVGRG
jgi:hypothetical protein